jgi:hypothetical protein
VGGDQSPLLPPEAGLNLNPGSYQSDRQCSPSLAGSCASPGSVVHLRPSPHLAERSSPSSGSSCLLAPDGVFSRWSRDAHPGNKGGDKSPAPQSQTSPQEMLWEPQAEIQDTEAV